jgi:hypothetical protein
MKPGIVRIGDQPLIGQRSTRSAGQGRAGPAPGSCDCIDNISSFVRADAMSASSLDLRRATSGFPLGHHIRRFTPRRWDGWLAAWRKETHDAIAIPVISYIKHQCYYNIYDYRRSARRRKGAPHQSAFCSTYRDSESRRPPKRSPKKVSETAATTPRRRPCGLGSRAFGNLRL